MASDFALLSLPTVFSVDISLVYVVTNTHTVAGAVWTCLAVSIATALAAVVAHSILCGYFCCTRLFLSSSLLTLTQLLVLFGIV